MIFSYLLNMQSHPSWVCGLKPRQVDGSKRENHVTPFVGVWIETCLCRCILLSVSVTPFVGVWIETTAVMKPTNSLGVTPFVGVWIETPHTKVQ